MSYLTDHPRYVLYGFVGRLVAIIFLSMVCVGIGHLPFLSAAAIGALRTGAAICLLAAMFPFDPGDVFGRVRRISAVGRKQESERIGEVRHLLDRIGTVEDALENERFLLVAKYLDMAATAVAADEAGWLRVMIRALGLRTRHGLMLIICFPAALFTAILAITVTAFSLSVIITHDLSFGLLILVPFVLVYIAGIYGLASLWTLEVFGRGAIAAQRQRAILLAGTIISIPSLASRFDDTAIEEILDSIANASFERANALIARAIASV